MEKSTERKKDAGIQKDSSDETSITNKDTIIPEGNDNVLEDDVMDAILGNIPVSEEDRPEIKKIIGMSMQMGRVISPEMEIMKKMTPEHVTEFLETQKQAMQNEFKESKDTKIFLVVVLILFLVFIIALVVLLKDKPDILEKVLYTLGGLIAGIFGGYGFGKTRGNE